MKIQDVLSESSKNDDKVALMQKHSELLKEIKEKTQKKVEAKDTESKTKNHKDAINKDADDYSEALERIKAVSIAARVARGEEVPRAQKDFLNSNYPDMLNDANIVKAKVEKVFKMIDGQKSKQDAEKTLQKIDSSILTLPYGSKGTTVFDKAVEIVNSKN